MKRTKMKRRKTPNKQIRSLGGHILNPPEDCQSPVFTHRDSDPENRWVDTYFCVHYCSSRYCSVAQAQFDESWRKYKEAHAKAMAKEE